MRHDLIDRRSLELNRLVAEKIRRQPELMDLVRGRLDRTLSEPRLSESCKDALREWQVILSTHSLNEVLEILTEDSDEGQRLRQSTPFTGILNQRERLDVFRRHEAAGA
jgi:DNA-directed RNA polymerase specialized sigma subunit